MEEHCLQKCSVYKAEVSSVNETKCYNSTAEGESKTWYNNHKKSFTQVNDKKAKDVSKYICNLNEKD